ncbi:hypothetical protein SASPL_143513 [Salvia splendens]|uniref:Uncharacterized protein n=1 Tax=Salvia splendens TaxID=180675 RepID=A0A8X8ZA35_SALSN|nr:hypothetical protein SASPL_143513 [Salvia splendens]
MRSGLVIACLFSSEEQITISRLLKLLDNEKPDIELTPPDEDCLYTYSRLKDLDPVATNRIHPNDQRKIKQYLTLSSSKFPKLLELKISRVACMPRAAQRKYPPYLKLREAVEKVKLNTRRLVRRQKRRIGRLQMLFGWNIHFVDVTSCLQGASDNSWSVKVWNHQLTSSNLSLIHLPAQKLPKEMSKRPNWLIETFGLNTFVKHAAIGSLEVLMSGSNTDKGAATGNELHG